MLLEPSICFYDLQDEKRLKSKESYTDKRRKVKRGRDAWSQHSSGLSLLQITLTYVHDLIVS
jgi:hypothetical protein